MSGKIFHQTGSVRACVSALDRTVFASPLSFMRGGVASAAAEEQPPAAEMIAWINTDKIHEMIGFDTHR